MARCGGVRGVTPQRIVVADAVRPMPDTVARGLGALRLEGLFDGHAYELAERGEALVGDPREARRGVGGDTVAPHLI
jgi:hypothetical protein